MAYPRLPLTMIAFLSLPAMAPAGQAQSKLAGSWALVEGVKELAGRQEPISESEHGRIYAVIKPDGTFYRLKEFSHSALDDLVNPGDRVQTPHASLTVTRSSYTAKRTELVLHHDDSGLDLSCEAELRPDGDLSFRLVTPSYGGADQVVTAVLRRVEGDRPWEPANLIAEWKVGGGCAFAVDLSADGRFVVGADLYGQSVILWDVKTRKELRRFGGHIQEVSAAAISPDGKRVASGSRVVDSTSTNDHALRIWEADTGQELQAIDDLSSVTGLSFLPDGNFLLACGIPNGSARGQSGAGLWNVTSGQREASYLGATDVRHIAVSRDGKSVLCAFDHLRQVDPIGYFDGRKGSELLRFGRGAYVPDSLAFSPDGGHAMTCNQEPFVREWNLQTGEEVRRFTVDSVWPTQAVYLPDATRILVANDSDNAIVLWDLRSGKKLMTLGGHRDHVYGLRVSTDGRSAASASADGTVRVWRIPPVEDAQ